MHGQRETRYCPDRKHTPSSNPLTRAIRKTLVRPQAVCMAGSVLAASLTGIPGLVMGLELSDLDGTNGFVVTGIPGPLRLDSLSDAGDVNSDGLSDVIIGTIVHTNPSDEPKYPVKNYVLFGRADGFPKEVNLSDLAGNEGFVINSIEAPGVGFSVSGAGDVNGDGVDDVIIGASQNSGRYVGNNSYVIFGNDKEHAAQIDVASLDDKDGFTIPDTGRHVSGAGDVNGDGIEDIILGAWNRRKDTNTNYWELERVNAYVIFGSTDGFPTKFEVSTLNGSNGFEIVSFGVYGNARRVARAGDVNGDGIDDVILGNNYFSFEAQSVANHVVFGSREAFPKSVIINELDGENGFAVFGNLIGGVSSAGDVNDDGFDDIMVANQSNYILSELFNSSSSHIVFGRREKFPRFFRLEGANNFSVTQLDRAFYSSGNETSVSLAGDFNGDGIDDAIFGADIAHYSYDHSKLSTGEAYIVFGTRSGFPAEIDSNDIDGNYGVTIKGITEYSRTGAIVSGGGDINGDGLDDVIIGAPREGSNGQAFVVFGYNDIAPVPAAAPPKLIHLGDINSDKKPDLAVLVHDPDAQNVTAFVKDITGKVLQTVYFHGEYQPVDVAMLADINGNETPEFAVLGQNILTNAARVEVRDVSAGALLSEVDFGVGLRAKNLAVVPDQNNNGIQELAVLDESAVSVAIRDAQSGQLVSEVQYTSRFTPLQVASWEDVNDTPSAVLPVLMKSSKPGGADKIEVRDAMSSMLISDIWLGKVFDAHSMGVVPDINGNGSSEVAVLRTGSVNVLLKDTQSGARLNKLQFNPNFEPVKLLVAPDVSDNGKPKVVVVGRNPDTQYVKAEVKDTESGQLVKNVWFNKSFLPQDAIIISDVNGNGSAEIALLGQNSTSKQLRVHIKDLLTGKHIRAMNF